MTFQGICHWHGGGDGRSWGMRRHGGTVPARVTVISVDQIRVGQLKAPVITAPNHSRGIAAAVNRAAVPSRRAASPWLQRMPTTARSHWYHFTGRAGSSG